MRRPPVWLWLVGLPGAVALGAMVVSRFVSAPLVVWDTAWTAAAAAALAGTVLGRRRAVGIHRFRWTMWTAAVACWLEGQIAWNVYGAHVPPSPNLGDVGWWGFAICALIGVLRSPARSRSLRSVAVVEIVPLIAAALALSCGLLWHDVKISPLSLASSVAVMCYPALYVAAATVTLQALLGGWLRSGDSVSSRMILLGIVIQAMTFSLWSEKLVDQSYVTGATILDPSWVFGLLVMAVGGVQAFRAPDHEVTTEPAAARGGLLPGLVFVALCAALIRAQLQHAGLAPRLALACGLLFCGSALILRSHLLSRRLRALLEQERGTVANLAERESELARLNRRLVEDSRHDPLTGMRNRRALAYDLPRLESAQRERGDAFAIAVCDIDHFKSYNDRLGHLAGDQALRTVSGLIRAELREGDVGYRFGGEELVLVFPSTGPEEAVPAAQRIRAAVATAALPHPGGIDGSLTVSIGVAAGCEDASALLARADAALYEAKRAGRNRVVAASGESNGAVRQRRSTDEESVPRQLRSILSLSRAAASGKGVTPVLQALAETIRLELSFEVVAVNLRDQMRDRLEVVVVVGDEDARSALLGTTNPWRDFEALIAPEFDRCGAIWLPAGTDLGDLQVWDPAMEAEDDPQAWDAKDMLLLPVRGADGDILAVVSVDRPMSGRRPQDGELSVLMAVADHAGLALERAQRDSQNVAALREQSAELRLAAVMLLAETLDLRDPGTGRHARTVGEYARHTAIELGLETQRVERIYSAGVVHDLGKIGMPDAILYKPGPLDEQEWREMKRHPEVGARILEHAGLLDIAAWVRCHHERVDGLGYPNGLSDAEIPLEAKILAVADAYEAMIADRPYRQGMAAEQARDELLRCAGTQFHPAVVDAFLAALGADPGADAREVSAAA